MAAKRRPGAPKNNQNATKNPADRVVTKTVPVRFNEDTKALVKKAAKLEGVSEAEFIREAAKRAATRRVRKG